jgi:hypothetical protein
VCKEHSFFAFLAFFAALRETSSPDRSQSEPRILFDARRHFCGDNGLRLCQVKISLFTRLLQ